MSDDPRTFGQLTRAGSLAGDELFAVENGDGNSRAITSARVRAYMGATVAANLATHIANNQAHGISTFVSTLLGASNLGALLTLLDIERSGDSSSGKLNIGNLLVLTWRDHTLASGATELKAYGSDHAYSSFARAWTEGNDGTTNEFGISAPITLNGTSGATIRNDGDATYTFTLFSIGV